LTKTGAHLIAKKEKKIKIYLLQSGKCVRATNESQAER